MIAVAKEKLSVDVEGRPVSVDIPVKEAYSDQDVSDAVDRLVTADPELCRLRDECQQLEGEVRARERRNAYLTCRVARLEELLAQVQAQEKHLEYLRYATEWENKRRQSAEAATAAALTLSRR